MMELTAVESSHIAAVGYLETDRVLLVRYRDGALYAHTPFSLEEFLALQSAPSKGRWLYARDRRGVIPVKITKGESGHTHTSPGHGAASTTAPLNVIDEDADPCCRKGLERLT